MEQKGYVDFYTCYIIIALALGMIPLTFSHQYSVHGPLSSESLDVKKGAVLAKEPSCSFSHTSEIGIPLILPILKMWK